MGVTNVMESDGGSEVVVKKTALGTAEKALEDVKAKLADNHEYNCQVINTMCFNWRSQVGLSASAFYYANATLIQYSQYCIDVIAKAKQTMMDFSDDMDIIDQDLEAMNFLDVYGSADEGE